MPACQQQEKAERSRSSCAEPKSDLALCHFLFLALIEVATHGQAAELEAAPTFTLNAEVYSGVLPLDTPREQIFEFQMSQLQKGQPPTAAFTNFYPRVIRL